jgi:hypothetical protein
MDFASGQHVEGLLGLPRLEKFLYLITQSRRLGLVPLGCLSLVGVA